MLVSPGKKDRSGSPQLNQAALREARAERASDDEAPKRSRGEEGRAQLTEAPTSRPSTASWGSTTRSWRADLFGGFGGQRECILRNGYGRRMEAEHSENIEK